MVLLGPGWCKIGFRASGNLTPARKSSQFLPHEKSQGDQLNVLIVPVIGHERCRPAISCPGEKRIRERGQCSNGSAPRRSGPPIPASERAQPAPPRPIPRPSPPRSASPPPPSPPPP